MQKEIKEFEITFTEKYNLNSDINLMWNDIKDKFKTITDKYVPIKYTSRSFQQPWFTTKTKRLIRKKKRWFKKMKENNTVKITQRYLEIKRQSQQACRSAHANYMKNLFNDDKNNKKLWSYIKSKNQEQSGIPDLKVNDIIIQDPNSKANSLNNQFASVFTNPLPEIKKKNESNMSKTS